MREFVKELLTFDKADRPSALATLINPCISSMAKESLQTETASKEDFEDVIKNMTKYKAKSLIHQACFIHNGMHNVSKE